MTKLARDLDRLTSALQAREYRLVPLCLEWTAMRLDRAEPRYPMVSANLLDALGKHEAAQSLRRDLRQRWESYAEHLLREEVRIGGVLYPPLISVTDESEVLPPWSGASETAVPVAKDSTQAAATATDSTARLVVPNTPSVLHDSTRSENTAPSTPPPSNGSP